MANDITLNRNYIDLCLPVCYFKFLKLKTFMCKTVPSFSDNIDTVQQDTLK